MLASALFIDAFFIFSGGDPKLFFKGAAKILCRRKSALERAILDGKKGVSHQLFCIAQPRRDEVFDGRNMVFFMKELPEIYLADACLLGKGCDAERDLAVMFVDIALGGADAVVLIIGGCALLRALKKQAVNAI